MPLRQTRLHKLAFLISEDLYITGTGISHVLEVVILILGEVGEVHCLDYHACVSCTGCVTA